MKSKLLILLVFTILVSCLIGAILYRSDIHTATIEELQEINGIGEILSERIVIYLKLNKDATIKDLDHIPGIGPVTIQKLRRKYYD